MKKLVIVGLFIIVAGVFGFRIYEERRANSADSGSGPGGAFRSAGRGRGAGGGAPGGFGGGRGGGASLLVETGTPAMHVFSSGSEFAGELLPQLEVSVIPRASGYLQAILVDQADTVRRGELLAEIDAADIEQQIRRQEAALAIVEAGKVREEATLENLRSQVQRTHQLLDKGLVAREVVEDVESRLRVGEAQLQLAQSQVDQAEAALGELRIQRERTRVYSPMDGVVAKRHVDPGALVGQNTPILTVIDLSGLRTIVAAPEGAVPDMKIGTGAEILFDALPGRRYRGRVARISPLVDTATRSVNVEIQIANPERLLRPGMFARVRVGGSAAAPALSIPRSALLTRGNSQGVYLLGPDNTAMFREIEIGRNEEGWVEVLRGLEASDTFVTAGAQSVNDGDRVRLAGEGSEEPGDFGRGRGPRGSARGGAERGRGPGERGSNGERP